MSDCVIKGCTINVNSPGVTLNLNTSATLDSCIINLGSNTTFAVTGTLTNCFVYMNSGGTQNPISCSGSPFNLVGNKFVVGTFSSPPTSILSVANGSNGNIVDNMFFRSGTTFTNGYILAPATGAVVVGNNFFDSTTYNGSDMNLVKNMPLTWKYAANLNTPLTRTVRRITGAASYTIVPIDHIITLDLSLSAMTISLPSLTLTPQGREIIIKDVSGLADIRPITLVRANPTETIDGLFVDYIYMIPFGSLTIIADGFGWVTV